MRGSKAPQTPAAAEPDATMTVLREAAGDEAFDAWQISSGGGDGSLCEAARTLGVTRDAFLDAAGRLGLSFDEAALAAIFPEDAP